MGDNPENESSSPAQFAAQSATAEDILKSQTVGLVTLSDFRKRRAEIAEQKDRESHDAATSGEATPQQSSGGGAPQNGKSTTKPAAKKRKRPRAGGKLSFGLDDDDEDQDIGSDGQERKSQKSESGDGLRSPQPRMRPNSSIGSVPKAMTKSALNKAAEMKEKMRKDFLAIQEKVRNTDIAIPFVFYDGVNVAGGNCKVKKGDPVWLFLDHARKLGAELGVSGADKTRKDWARISVDDLMLVRDQLIIPPHYDFYYFIVNRTCGYQGLLFDYSSRPVEEDKSNDNKESSDQPLQGANHDASATKVVDRRWYERNKHIYPASIWEEFDSEKDYTKATRTDARGNSFFFS